MDALVVVVLIFLAIFFVKRTFEGAVFAFAITDIFLRAMTFIKNNIGAKDISNVIDKYLPENIPAILAKYTDGLFYKILLWLYFAIMVVFLFCIIRIFIKKK